MVWVWPPPLGVQVSAEDYGKSEATTSPCPVQSKQCNVNAVKVMTQVLVLTSLSLGDLLLGCKEYKETDQPLALGIEQLLPPGGRRHNCCFKRQADVLLLPLYLSQRPVTTQKKRRKKGKNIFNIVSLLLWLNLFCSRDRNGLPVM